MKKPYRIHVYPLDIKKPNGRWTSTHVTDKSEMCGCKPKVMQACPEWEHEDGKYCKPNCWKCGGLGLVEPYNPEFAYLIVHNDQGKPCYPDMPDEQLAAK